jgi:deoxyribodipyrimidine photo-lyase
MVWKKDEALFWKWAEGKTGFPIVDAGMRELNHTGYMHNRVRMITASFLVKDLHLSWRWGERYFAQHLVDYDPCLNNGNWQWAASTGCDAQPYFRIFNPWLQQAKFDADCVYIKRWIPELADYDSKTIHQWYKQSGSEAYPLPIVDHSQQAALIKEQFKRLNQNKDR